MNYSPAAIEVLESRIAPAAVVVYTDVDGDIVTIQSSQGNHAQLESILTFANAGVGKQLETIDFAAAPTVFGGTSLIVSAVHGPLGGDGHANVGYINATGIDLGTVAISGDLGRIDAGNGRPEYHAVSAIKTISMGEYGTTTQAAGGSLVSNLANSVGGWTVVGDVGPVTVNITNATSSHVTATEIGRLKIEGSLGGTFTDTGGFHLVDIGGNIDGGSLNTTHGILEMQVGGSIIGNNTDFSGSVNAGTILKIVVNGNLVGSGGADSGTIIGVDNATQPLGGRAIVEGSVFGGSGTGSGGISGTNPGYIAIYGDLKGGSGPQSGEVAVGVLDTIDIGGSIVGGSASEAGGVYVTKSVLQVTVGQDIRGGSGQFSGAVDAGNGIGNVHVGGSLVGGSGADITGGGQIEASAGSIVAHTGSINNVYILGSISGGAGAASGSVFAGESVDYFTVKGSMDSTAGSGTASVYSQKNIGNVTVGGDILGLGNMFGQQGGTATGQISEFSLTGSLLSPLTVNDGIQTAKIGQSIIANGAGEGGSLFVNGTKLSEVTIGGSVTGTSTDLAMITVDGSASPATETQALAIAGMNIGGSVSFAQILAGYSESGGTVTADHADISIGALRVVGDWQASSLAAGAKVGGGGQFGTVDNVAIPGGTAGLFSRIGHVTVLGEILGDPGSANHYGFVAQEIDQFTATITNLPLKAGPGNDDLNIGATLDTTVLEVA